MDRGIAPDVPTGLPGSVSRHRSELLNHSKENPKGFTHNPAPTCLALPHNHQWIRLGPLAISGDSSHSIWELTD